MSILLEDSFLIENTATKNNKVKSLTLKSTSGTQIIVEYCTLYFTPKEEKVDVIIVQNGEEHSVPKEYNYLTQGPVYNVKSEDGELTINVSFHGLLMEYKGNRRLSQEVDDKCQWMVGLK